MIKLKTYPLKRTYFVEDNVIYNIANTTKPTTDTHAIIYKDGSSFPYLQYVNDGHESITYYLDSLIEDGDKLSDGAFAKVCHEFEEEPEMPPFDYFKALCELQIAKVIADNFPRKYKYYYDADNNIKRLETLGVPAYMFKQNHNSYTNFKKNDGKETKDVVESDLIDFTEEKFNELLNDEILRRTKEAANKVANTFSKTVKTLELKDI